MDLFKANNAIVHLGGASTMAISNARSAGLDVAYDFPTLGDGNCFYLSLVQQMQRIPLQKYLPLIFTDSYKLRIAVVNYVLSESYKENIYIQQYKNHYEEILHAENYNMSWLQFLHHQANNAVEVEELACQCNSTQENKLKKHSYHELFAMLDCPKLFVIHTDRTDVSRQSKTDTPVIVQEEIKIDICALNVESNLAYKLAAAINHSGETLKQGHYTTTVYTKKSVITFNDMNIIKRNRNFLNDNEFMTTTHMLFYIRNEDKVKASEKRDELNGT